MERHARVFAWLGTLLIGLGASYESLAFSIETHRLLNDSATQKSSADTYLKVQLGLPKGLETLFDDQSASEWIIFGGASEDQAFRVEPLGAAFRSRQHFHNPLVTWDQAGLNAPSLCTLGLPLVG